MTRTEQIIFNNMQRRIVELESKNILLTDLLRRFVKVTEMFIRKEKKNER